MTTQLVTLAQAKAFIGNAADTTDDAILQRIVDSVSSFVESTCARTLGVTNYVEHRSGNGGRMMVLANAPIATVLQLSVDGVTIPQSTAWDRAGWVIAAPWRLELRGDVYRFTAGALNVSVSYSAGYATIPGDLQHATLTLVSMAYKERDRMGLTSKSVGGETISFTTDLPEVVRMVLDDYKSVAVPA